MARSEKGAHEVHLKALRGFHAIVRTGSVTAAAREMGLSQPTVSRILHQLERQVGFELFYRDRGRLVVTADGLMLFDEVDLALGQMDRLAGIIEDIDAYRTGELKLVAPPSFAEGVLPDIASAFLAAYPKVRLSIDSRSVETAKQLVTSRAVDAGFLKLPIDRPDLRAERIVSSQTAAVLARGHPLAREEVLTPAVLRGEPLILLGRGRESRHQIESAFRAAGVAPTVRVETHTIGSACALASRGLGIALVNELLARASLPLHAAELRPFRPRLMQDYAFVTSASAAPSRLASAFLDQARQYFARSGEQASGRTIMGQPVAESV